MAKKRTAPVPYKLVIRAHAPGTEYMVLEWLGAGGMGAVYRVIKFPAIESAMKIMHPELVKQPGAVERFIQEVALQGALDGHENLVKIKDFGKLADGTPFVVMELLEGKTLQAAIHLRIERGQPPMPGHIAYEITNQVSKALTCLHSQPVPIVHRDLKPANIFLQLPKQFGSDEPQKPRVKVLDFGVARFADGTRERGRGFGTLRYMSPEQLRGEHVTVKADQYALALVLYEMLTNQFCYEVSSQRDEDEIAHAHQWGKPIPPSHWEPSIPPAVDAVILAGLEKDPNRRPRSVAIWVRDLFVLTTLSTRAGAYEISADVNPTSPTFAGMVNADESGNANEPRGEDRDTYRDYGGTPLPIEGPTLETVAGEFLPAGKGFTQRMSVHPPPHLPQQFSNSSEALLSAPSKPTAEVAGWSFGGRAEGPPLPPQPKPSLPSRSVQVSAPPALLSVASIVPAGSSSGTAHSVMDHDDPIVIPRQTIPRALLFGGAGVLVAAFLCVVAVSRWERTSRAPSPASASEPPQPSGMASAVAMPLPLPAPSPIPSPAVLPPSVETLPTPSAPVSAEVAATPRAAPSQASLLPPAKAPSAAARATRPTPKRTDVVRDDGFELLTNPSPPSGR